MATPGLFDDLIPADPGKPVDGRPLVAAEPSNKSTTLSGFREQYPQYGDMSDDDLASALHTKFYSDIPRTDFNAKLGLSPTAGMFDDLVPAKPKKQAEMREYQSTSPWRDAAARFLMPDERASPLREKAVEMVTGSRGLGRTGTISLADLNPVTGPLLAGNEVVNAPDALSAVTSAIGVIPAPGVKDIMARGAAQVAQTAARAAPAAATAGGPTPANVAAAFDFVTEGGRTKAVLRSAPNDATNIVDITDLVKTGMPKEEAVLRTMEAARGGAGVNARGQTVPVNASGWPAGTPAWAQAPEEAAAAVTARAAQTGRLNPDLPARDQIAAAAEKEGIKIPFAAATDSRALQQISGNVSDIPFAGKPLVDSSKDALKAIERRTGEVRDAFSGSPGSAGDTFRDAARAWTDDGAKAVSRRIFDNVERRVKPTVEWPINRTGVEARKITAEMLESAGQAARGTLARVQEALQRPNGLTFRGMRGLRSEVGELIEKSVADTSMSQGALKRIYKSLSEDMQHAISRPKTKGGGGPKGLIAWQRANKLYGEIKDRQKILGDIIGTQGDAPSGTIVERIKTLGGSKGGSDINRLISARKAVGTEAWDSVAANLVQNMGDTKNGFSIAQFRTNYMKLSEEGRTALFSSTGKDELKQSLDRLSVIGQGAEALMRFANTSNSGRLGAVVAGGGALGASLFNPWVLAGMLGGMAHGYVFARVMARPVAARALADAGEAAMKAIASSNPTAMKQYELLMAQFLRVAGPELAAELAGAQEGADDDRREIRGVQ